jgi:hypothetical protein
MFVLNEERIVKWPVVVEVPVDGGKVEEQQFEMTFRLLPGDQVKEVKDFADVILGWDGVQSEAADGTRRTLEFSAQALERMLGIPYARAAIVRAYIACSTGATRKNSNRPLAIGPAAATQAPETTK